MYYSNEELKILEAIENGNIEKEPFDNDEIKQIAKETKLKMYEKKQISINLKKIDLEIIKKKADAIGISYQNIIQALVHNYATNKITLEI